MTPRDRVEAELQKTVGVRWGNGCFAERKLWGECPDLAGESCPYCWALSRLRHQRAEGLRDAAKHLDDQVEGVALYFASELREMAIALEGKGENENEG